MTVNSKLKCDLIAKIFLAERKRLHTFSQILRDYKCL